MKKLKNIHPWEILQEEFLGPMKLSTYRLAKATKIPATRISEILKRRRSITVDTALRFAKFFGTTPDFWLGLQMEYDLRRDSAERQKMLDSIQSYEEIVRSAGI